MTRDKQSLYNSPQVFKLDVRIFHYQPENLCQRCLCLRSIMSRERKSTEKESLFSWGANILIERRRNFSACTKEAICYRNCFNVWANWYFSIPNKIVVVHKLDFLSCTINARFLCGKHLMFLVYCDRYLFHSHFDSLKSVNTQELDDN